MDSLAIFKNTPKKLMLKKRGTSRRQGLYVLATPTFASKGWLEASSDFIPKLLQEVVGVGAIPFEVDVVCGEIRLFSTRAGRVARVACQYLAALQRILNPQLPLQLSPNAVLTN